MPDARTLHTALEAVPGHEKWISQLWVCAYAGKHAPNPMASVSGAALLGTLGIGSGAGSGAGAQQAFGAHVERLALLLKRNLFGSNKSNAATVSAAVFGATLLVSLRVSFAVTFVLLACAGSFAFAAFLATWVLDKDEGSPEMRDISDAIRQGADGFFRVQYGLIARLAFGAAGAIFLVYSFRRLTNAQVAAGVTRGSFACLTTVAFVLGAGCSALSGYVGMWVSVRERARRRRAGARRARRGRRRAGLPPSRRRLRHSRRRVLYGSSRGSTGSLLRGLRVPKKHLQEPNGRDGASVHDVPLMLVGYGFGASSSRSSRSSAAAYPRKPRTSGRTSWVKSRLEFRKTTRGTPR